MAARVNTKVVVPLIVVLLVVVSGVIGLAYFTIYRTPEFYKSRGDAAAATGDWRTAEEFYSKGVNRDQGNIELLDLWRESIEHIVPADSIEAIAYYQKIRSLVRKKTESRPFEPQFHIDWLNRELASALPNMTPPSPAMLAEEVDRMFAGKSSGDDNPLWEQAYRFRGIANTYRMREAGFDAQLSDQALSDLQRWLKSDPDDSLAMDTVIRWHAFKANGLASGSKPREALAELDTAENIASEFLQSHPDEVLIRMTLVQILQARQAIERGLPDGAGDALPRMRELVADAERLALQREDLPVWLTIRLATDLIWTAPNVSEGLSRAIAMVEHALIAHPNSPTLKFERAEWLANRGQREDSMAAYQEIIDAPNLPISRDSVWLFDYRRMAIIALFDMDTTSWRTTDLADAQAVALAKAKVQARLDQYRSLVSSTDAQLPYLEGRFALSERNLEVAANKLNQFLTTAESSGVTTGRRVAALVDLAIALQGTNRAGAAYEYLAEADRLTGGRNGPILRTLVEVDLGTKNFERAQKNLDRLVALEPDGESTLDLRNRLVLAQGGDNTSVVNDESLAAIVEARELLASSRVDEARALLLKIRQSDPENMQAVFELSRLEYVQGNIAKALEYIESALASHPGSEPLLILQAQLAGSDLRPVLNQIVDNRPGLSEFDRHLGKWQLYRQNGFADEAAKEFQAAKAIQPDAPAIIEQDFASALQATDLPAAQNALRRAQQTNADLANGLTFRGRYELKDFPKKPRDTAAAISTLLQATTLKPYDSFAWRLLGGAYGEAGNYTAAMDAFAKSLEKEPNSVGTLKELARLQLQRGDTTKALETIRKAKNFAAGDEGIYSDYLDLEGRYGDRAKIITVREGMREAGTGGIQNAVALVQLYELDNNFSEAKKVLDSLAPKDQSEALLIAQARSIWHASQGQFDDGRNALLAFLQSTPKPSNELMTRAMLSLCQYEVNAGQMDKAIETAKAAAQYQDPTRREAEHLLGDLYLRLNQREAALETYERAFVNSEVSPALGIQIINLHLMLADEQATSDPKSAARHRKRAGELLDAQEKATGATLEALLFRAQLTLLNGDPITAENIFNDAVAKYPQDSRVYSSRARFNLGRIIGAGDIGRANRVRADVDQAMQLSPGNADPLWVLVDLARARRNPATGEPDPDIDAMMAAWRRILQIEPRNAEVRQVLVRNLYVKGENAAARVLLEEGIASDPTNALWYELRGDLERQSGAPAEKYVNYYQQALDREFSTDRLAQLAEALLRLTPPRADQVLQLLRRYDSEVAGNPVHRLIFARAQMLSGDATAALKSLRAAAEMIVATTDTTTRDGLLKLWYGWYLPAIVPPDQFKAVSDASFGSLDDPWPQALLGMALYSASARIASGDSASLAKAGIEQMAAAEARIKTMPAGERRTQQFQAEVGQFLSDVYYAEGDTRQAVETWRWLLEVAPDDLKALNNTAFVLAHDLDDPAAALEPAKRAYDLNPADATVLDTYGYVLFRNGRLDEAERILRSSLDREEQSGARMHLGQVLLAKGNADAAQRELTRARSLAQQQGATKRVKEIDELLKGP